MTETTEQSRKCSNCMWWDALDFTLERGFCHGAPPLRSANGGADWPQTRCRDWCGSFRMKEPGQ